MGFDWVYKIFGAETLKVQSNQWFYFLGVSVNRTCTTHI